MTSKVTAAQVNRFLKRSFNNGNRCHQVGEGWATARIDTAPIMLRPGEIISGPTIFGACDAALYYAVFTAIGVEPMALTSDMSIRFLRPARGAKLFARADLLSVGRRSIVGSVVAWTDDRLKPVAVAQGTYVRPIR